MLSALENLFSAIKQGLKKNPLKGHFGGVFFFGIGSQIHKSAAQNWNY